MALPYENTTSGEKAVQDMQKILQKFGCSKFGQMMDWEAGELLIQFEFRGRPVSMKASVNGYAQAWLKEHPYSSRSRTSKVDYERKAKQIAGVAVYSILRDWIKGQVVAIETGILSFEGAFLGSILLANGNTILEEVRQKGILSLADKNHAK